MTRSEAVIAQWLQLNEASLLLETGSTIATKTGTSEITVSRFLRRLGYKGLIELKTDLQLAAASNPGSNEYFLHQTDSELGLMIRRDAEAVLAISAQTLRPEWQQAIDEIHGSDEVFVTGFQCVRGAAEDFARRLAIIRPSVRFMAAHESGLAEWLVEDRARRSLILVDTMPYAREAQPMVELAIKAGMIVIVVTEDRNVWASKHTPYVFFVANKMTSYVGSSGPLGSMLSLIVHAVAAKEPDKTKSRLAAWPHLLRNLQLT